ncbi:hypothetical protein SLE2022_293980 [Rubroshorea leprosula]
MVELKQHILTSLSKLSGRDTQQVAVKDLEKIIQSLSLNKKIAKNFVFGVSTAAAQIEGSTTYGERGPSIWDQFIKEKPRTIMEKSDNLVAIDSYKQCKEDVLAIKDIGVDANRFSISWTRILPYINLVPSSLIHSLLFDLVKLNNTRICLEFV